MSFISTDLFAALTARAGTRDTPQFRTELRNAAISAAIMAGRQRHQRLFPNDRAPEYIRETNYVQTYNDNQLDSAAGFIRIQRAASQWARDTSIDDLASLIGGTTMEVDLGERTGVINVSPNELSSLNTIPAQHVLDTLRDAYPEFLFTRSRQYLQINTHTAASDWNTLNLVQRIKEVTSYIQINAGGWQSSYGNGERFRTLVNRQIDSYIEGRAYRPRDADFTAYLFEGTRGTYQTTRSRLSEVVESWQQSSALSRADILRMVRAKMTGQTGATTLPERIPTAAELQFRADRFVAFYSKAIQRNSAANLNRAGTPTAAAERAAADAWNSIPILDHGTIASRTWGIEVESVHASSVARAGGTPEGWDRKYDGSLRSEERGGDYDDDNCTDCGYDEEDCSCEDGFQREPGADTEFSGAQEFASPILRSFHSRGLQRITGALSSAPSNSTPGVHVHVGASDLTGKQVAAIVSAYTIIEPLLTPVYQRESRQYCRPMDLDKATSFSAHVDKSALLNNSAARQRASSTYGERYRSVNLQSLSSHTTIEFRAMGAVYNYEYLLRWAWFVREFTNVAAVLPLDRFARVETLSELIQLLIEYGSENVPTSKLMSTMQSSIDALTTNERQLVGA